jgi:glutamate--cysteine ligase
VPEAALRIMREYLPTRGGHALDMMLRTCTVQANSTTTARPDAMRKMRVALKLSPATTAMFANSPWKEGARTAG